MRPALAMDPRAFGRRAVLHATARAPSAGWSGDVRLFASTFTIGFVMVSFLIF